MDPAPNLTQAKVFPIDLNQGIQTTNRANQSQENAAWIVSGSKTHGTVADQPEVSPVSKSSAKKASLMMKMYAGNGASAGRMAFLV